MNNTILLVEDNPDDTELTIMALSENRIGNEIKHVWDGEEALQYLDDCSLPSLPQLVLLDLKLPKISGLEVLKQIRSSPRTNRLPVVVLTSSDEDQDIAACYDSGVNSYIRKPVDFDQFSECVKQLGLYWLVLNIGPPEM
ncbi:MAG: response regulator [Candidatus Thorarchaeota archaeon]|nr:response regulator [Candidatus Thorarchaeota archaeon]